VPRCPRDAILCSLLSHFHLWKLHWPYCGHLVQSAFCVVANSSGTPAARCKCGLRSSAAPVVLAVRAGVLIRLRIDGASEILGIFALAIARVCCSAGGSRFRCGWAAGAGGHLALDSSGHPEHGVHVLFPGLLLWAFHDLQLSPGSPQLQRDRAMSGPEAQTCPNCSFDPLPVTVLSSAAPLQDGGLLRGDAVALDCSVQLAMLDCRCVGVRPCRVVLSCHAFAPRSPHSTSLGSAPAFSARFFASGCGRTSSPGRALVEQHSQEATRVCSLSWTCFFVVVSRETCRRQILIKSCAGLEEGAVTGVRELWDRHLHGCR